MDNNAEARPRGDRRAQTDEVPPNDSPSYRSTALRHPTQPLVIVPQTLSEITGPAHGDASIGPLDHDLTRQHAGEPLGERIIIAGRVVDEDDRATMGVRIISSHNPKSHSHTECAGFSNYASEICATL